MFKREMDILREMANDFSAYRGIIKAIAYGSRVRGDCKGNSDLDVLIIIDKKDKALKDKILDLVYSYELNSDLPCSVTILSLSEYKYNEQLGSPFVKNIKKEGMNRFLMKFLFIDKIPNNELLFFQEKLKEIKLIRSFIIHYRTLIEQDEDEIFLLNVPLCQGMYFPEENQERGIREY